MADCNTAALTRRRVLMAKIQSDCNPAAVTDADAFRIYNDTSASFGDVSVNSRGEVASNSLSMESDVMGLLAATISGRAELVGAGVEGVTPEADTILRASGMARTALQRLEISGLAAPGFVRGAQISNGTGGTGRVVVPADAGADFVHLEVTAGSFAPADTITETAGAVDATADAVAIARIPVGAVVGGVVNVGETLTASGGATLRAERRLRNGDAFLYFTTLSGSVASGETLSVRNKSTTTTGAEESVAKVAVDTGSAVYKLREGVDFTTAGASGTILETYSGIESFVFYGPGTGSVATGETLTAAVATASVENVVANGGFAYKPISSGFERATFRLWEDGKQKEIYSAMATWSLAVNANELPILSFSALGPINQVQTGDAATEPAPVFPESVPAAFQLAEGKILDSGAETLPVGNSFSLDYGGQVSIRPDYNSPSGAVGSISTARTPNGALEVEQVPESSYPLFRRFFSGTLSSLQAKFGSEFSKMVWVFVDAAQWSGVENGDQNGILTNSISYGAKKIPRTAGDNELELVFL